MLGPDRAKRERTHTSRFKRPLLYQLSYTSISTRGWTRTNNLLLVPIMLRMIAVLLRSTYSAYAECILTPFGATIYSVNRYLIQGVELPLFYTDRVSVEGFEPSAYGLKARCSTN